MQIYCVGRSKDINFKKTKTIVVINILSLLLYFHSTYIIKIIIYTYLQDIIIEHLKP